MKTFRELLNGGDLRSIGKSNEVITLITDQESFDNLFSFLFSNKRIVVMRAADAIEKVTVKNKEYLLPHKEELLQLLKITQNKELKWHLALLVSRITLNKNELSKVWDTLTNWALDNNQSRIVRVNAIQSLYELSCRSPKLKPAFEQTMITLQEQNIPSITTRIKKIRKHWN